MATLKEMVDTLQRIRAKRLKLEQQAKEMVVSEKELEQRILSEMAAVDTKSATLVFGEDNRLRVTSKDVYHYEIEDIEKLTNYMFSRMVDAVRNGGKTNDALLFRPPPATLGVGGGMHG